ncbi:MAG: transcriptional repressor [Spirochaetes bacterium]|nr:transcriptional repressor [Spirochaetota bacterium]
MSTNLTSRRKKILDTVNKTPLPVSARDVYESVKKKINLATVYRGLQYLEDNNYIEAFTIACSREGTVRYYHGKELPHRHFFHCELCHKFLPFLSCSLNKELELFEKYNNCSVNRHVLYLTGICGSCRE